MINQIKNILQVHGMNEVIKIGLIIGICIGVTVGISMKLWGFGMLARGKVFRLCDGYKIKDINILIYILISIILCIPFGMVMSICMTMSLYFPENIIYRISIPIAILLSIILIYMVCFKDQKVYSEYNKKFMQDLQYKNISVDDLEEDLISFCIVRNNIGDCKYAISDFYISMLMKLYYQRDKAKHSELIKNSNIKSNKMIRLIKKEAPLNVEFTNDIDRKIIKHF